MDKDFIFVMQHKKASGIEAAKSMLKEMKEEASKVKDHDKVYINVYGNEVHVKGPSVVTLAKPESLAEKIARFERLAEQVRINRSLLQGLVQEIVDDEDPNDDDNLDDVKDYDDFGEVIEKDYVVKTQKTLPLNEGNVESAGEKAAATQKPSAAEIAKDEALADDEVDN